MKQRDNHAAGGRRTRAQALIRARGDEVPLDCRASATRTEATWAAIRHPRARGTTRTMGSVGQPRARLKKRAGHAPAQRIGVESQSITVARTPCPGERGEKGTRTARKGVGTVKQRSGESSVREGVAKRDGARPRRKPPCRCESVSRPQERREGAGNPQCNWTSSSFSAQAALSGRIS